MVSRLAGAAALSSLLVLLAGVTNLATAQSSAKSINWTVLCVGTYELSSSACLVIANACEARGQPFVYWNSLADLADGAIPTLVNNAGVGLFAAIFFESENLAYSATGTSWVSALTAAQWTALDNYQTTFGVRRVNLHTYPNFNGMAPASNAATQYLKFTAQGAAFDPSFKASALIDLKFSYVTGADLANAPNMAAVAYLYASTTDTTARGVGAAIEVDDGVETWHWFAMQAAWYPGQIAAAGVSLQWALRGVFLGERRVSLSMQIDDLFLTTDAWNPNNPAAEEDPTAPQLRVTPAEVNALASFSTKATNALPAGSLIKYEWAWNGAGVAENGGVTKDPLVAAVKNNVNNFWFVSHTYTHPNMSVLTYTQCLSEITQNTNMMKQIWGKSPPASIGTAEMVTPSITGLFNGECLRALQAGGIFTVVGDNSHPELMPQTYGLSPYAGIWTTVPVNGFAGTFIIPRWATNIYFNDMTPANDLAHFHYMTKNADQKTWTWQQLLDFEGETTARNAMNYRQDPYMFHQANVKTFSYSGWPDGSASLLAVWTANALKWITQYTNFPVVSVQEKAMRQNLLNRMSRDACGITAVATAYNGVPVQFGLSSTASCVASISGITATTTLPSVLYGPERTISVTLSPTRPVSLMSGLLPTCPIVNGAYCAGHGMCDATRVPPVCSCNVGWTGIDCNTPQYTWGTNLLLNAGFETGALPTADNWSPYANGYTRAAVTATAHTGSGSLMLNVTDSGAAGASQYYALNQATATAIQISAWGFRPSAVIAGPSAYWRVYADVVHTDGSWHYGVIGNFDRTVTTWQQASAIYTPTIPIQAVFVYVMSNDMQGIYYADDVALVQQTAAVDTRPISTDGRCGFNSPTNARCPLSQPCCSSAGLCGSTIASCSNGGVTTVVTTTTTTLVQCTKCRNRTSGPCKSLLGTCYAALANGNCPSGTTACTTKKRRLSSVVAPLQGSDAGALVSNPAVQAALLTGLSTQLGVDADDIQLHTENDDDYAEDGSINQPLSLVVYAENEAHAAVLASHLNRAKASILHDAFSVHNLAVDAAIDHAQIVSHTADDSDVSNASLLVVALVGCAGVAAVILAAMIVIRQRRQAHDIRV